MTQTLANSNQNRFPLDFRHTFTVILPSVTRTLDNSNSCKLEPIFVSPQVIFYIILPSITRAMFWALKKSGKKPSTSVWTNEFWISYYLREFGVARSEADVDCHRLTWSSFTSQNSKTHALFRLCFVCYVLICNLEVSLNFHVTFLQLNVIKMFTVQ